jgi:pimeloyl-ACP methyl ester carboxylesterase
VDLYYEETGQGAPLVWSHEFGGDCRTWEPQVRYFARRYRVITEADLKALRVPPLIMVGDQDTPCVEPSRLMRDWIPHAGLVTFAACGHTPNVEEPALFDLHASEFLAAVDAGRWAGRSR